MHAAVEGHEGFDRLLDYDGAFDHLDGGPDDDSALFDYGIFDTDHDGKIDKRDDVTSVEIAL